jgi:hypothetical protein
MEDGAPVRGHLEVEADAVLAVSFEEGGDIKEQTTSRTEELPEAKLLNKVELGIEELLPPELLEIVLQFADELNWPSCQMVPNGWYVYLCLINKKGMPEVEGSAGKTMAARYATIRVY